MGAERFLVDTNILVYAHDRSEYRKQIRCREILDGLVRRGAGVLSTQVLAEFYCAVTRKLSEPLSPQQGLAQLGEFVQSWRVLGITPETILEAARGVVDHRFGFYDAQVWATAKLNRIPTVLSEDFSHLSRVEGVTFLNPLIAAVSGEE